MLLAPSTSVEENSSITFEEGQISEDERQYADLSDREEDSSTGGGDPYDEPPTESGDRASKVYEEVSVPSNKPAALPNRQLSEPGQADASDLPTAVDEKSGSG
ncbi:hypothetical protein EB796_001719 [Bugula neritina]|uniref:Uncharacterized protein n=1 Tax=Bugula neritina TaxID=10212 RepID=A0A7J7KP91_BUGNE|nr:hypothetical protein EB796_001719 [Bugula neritina]